MRYKCSYKDRSFIVVATDEKRARELAANMFDKKARPWVIKIEKAED